MLGKLEFSRNHLLREGKGQNLVPVSHLISWKEISHRSGNLSDHLAEQARDTYDVQEHSLIIHTLSPLAKGKPQGGTLKMDSRSLALCSSLEVASQNQYPFPDFMSLVCSMGLVRRGYFSTSDMSQFRPESSVQRQVYWEAALR